MLSGPVVIHAGDTKLGANIYVASDERPVDRGAFRRPRLGTTGTGRGQQSVRRGSDGPVTATVLITGT